ncbi:Uu.00g081170.m01.CDS01 [Anthostomella pinea]|uniref:prephenate dehydratase n=1 Tax=Anthostomella pinea TaxID=933095 RepID=A0AAI8YJ99_9PEZI|nr:Uu.00g081170.m01.CDS01 [Anthostomella pinea]
MGSSRLNVGDEAQAGSAAKPVVCFLGPVSSYTHQATMETFPADKFELMPVVTIKDIFDTTQSGRATYGVVPFENSTNGSVVFTLDHFADRSNAYPDLNVCREIYLDVHHCILGHIAPSSSSPSSSQLQSQNPSSSILQQPQSQPESSREDKPSSSAPKPPNDKDDKPATAQPLHSLAHIQRIYSHPQAFGQCTRFLGAHLRGVETVDMSSTSRAAELALADTTKTSAAISSLAAAELLGDGIDVLARNVEDRDDNTTRFFVLRRGTATSPSEEEELLLTRAVSGDEKTQPQKPGEGSAVTEEAADKKASTTTRHRPTKSLVSFTVPHHAPGGLAAVLDCFRRGGLNLTSISSRPSLAGAFQYVFFVEFEGHRFADPEGRVGEVLEGVGEVARSWRWLGSWEDMLRGRR